ncbi:arylsulfatase B-like [Harmonia axyridis]|uniref:arylsulfatase B-like n=1 Tax=Harmonia axyridis TaxID=115357 RepID=UPI001E277B97|nr:arylsulfatase B-like [Harmonia axyridis]
MKAPLYIFLTALVFAQEVQMVKNAPPNIIMILADDMGSNDASYRGSDQFTTPNIDALGYNGLIFDRHYTEPICTPSRAALLTGQNPSKLGLQGTPIAPGEDRHLPVEVETLPSLLKNLGYDTHLVGKWHLGSARRKETPTRRGFDSHYGYWNGYVGYFSYEVSSISQIGNVTKALRGFDLWHNFTDAWSDKGTYATDLFTKKALEVIQEQNVKVPLFLMVNHLAVHTGDDDIVEVKDEKLMNETFGYIENLERRRYADALTQLDNSVGKIVEKLQEKEMLNNSVLIFMSDNGAQINGFYHNGGSNFPLRGEKFSLHEGGVRNAAVMYSPLLEKKNYVYKYPLHITDWLPTLYSLAGGNLSLLKNLDGVNQWDNICRNKPSQKKDFLINIDEAIPYSAIIGYHGQFKLMNGTTLSGFYDKYGEEPKVPKKLAYNISAVLGSSVNKAIHRSNPDHSDLTPCTIIELRKSASTIRQNLKCKDKGKRNKPDICSGFCLFDLLEDPCETENLIKDESKKDIINNLKFKLQQYWEVMVPQTNKAVDIESNPAKYNGSWCTWKDDQLCVKTPLKI